MRSSTIKWIAGAVFFFLPAITVAVGKSFFYENLGAAFTVSMVMAAVIPAALVLSASVRWRIALVFGLWALLLVEFCLILVSLLAGFRE
jgi:hypothetical protein